MNGFDLNRRQFLQLGASAALAAQTLAPMWALGENTPSGQARVTRTDPHLALALAHQFVDHDLWAWSQATRLCAVLPIERLPTLKTILGDAGAIDSEFVDAGQVWVTLTLQTPALLRLSQSADSLLIDHIWGAPWSNPLQMAAPGQRPKPSDAWRQSNDDAWFSTGVGSARQRALIIDHGFPVQRLRQLGVPHLHRTCPWAKARGRADLGAGSHAAQVTGLWLHGVDGDAAVPQVPLVLAELPDEILTSMPYGALWPQVLDAIHWAIRSSAPGSEWLLMLSLVSTDADRHAESFISRSARALTAYARSKGVTLTWVMAAGNSHADQQNIDLRVRARQPAEMHWHLPPENFRPSFLECWHDASMGQPVLQIRPPGGAWSDQLQPMSLATRFHAPSGRTQTVFRLPPTAYWTPVPAHAKSGDWGLRFVFDRDGLLNLHLAMMTANTLGPLRQAHIRAAPSRPEDALSPTTLSGLIPHMPQVLVAQTLDPASTSWWVDGPSSQQLSFYSGRVPQGNSSHLHAMAYRVDASKVRSGALTWSRQGHRLQRATGTSMAVPLVARRAIGIV